MSGQAHDIAVEFEGIVGRVSDRHGRLGAVAARIPLPQAAAVM